MRRRETKQFNRGQPQSVLIDQLSLSDGKCRVEKKNNLQGGQLAPGQEERPRPLCRTLVGSVLTGDLNEIFLSAILDLFASDLLDTALTCYVQQDA